MELIIALIFAAAMAVGLAIYLSWDRINRTDRAFLFGVMWTMCLMGGIRTADREGWPDWAQGIAILSVVLALGYWAVWERSRGFQVFRKPYESALAKGIEAQPEEPRP